MKKIYLDLKRAQTLEKKIFRFKTCLDTWKKKKKGIWMRDKENYDGCYKSKIMMDVTSQKVSCGVILVATSGRAFSWNKIISKLELMHIYIYIYIYNERRI